MKYIFIDSNQYRHIFSKTEGFSDDVYNLLLKLIDNDHIKLLLPEQTKDEVERNRFYDWFNGEKKSIENNIEKLVNKKDKMHKNYSEFDYKKTEESICREIQKIEKEKDKLNRRYLNLRSKQNQKLRKLFSSAYYIEESEDVLKKADIRYKKGNPPYDNDKFGDALIWETLLSYLKTQKTNKPELIFVASDKKAWGDDYFHIWLEREFKNKTRGKIFFSKKISDIPGLTKEEQDRIKFKENEDLKNNAVADFISSSSFINAGSNSDKLLSYKKYLTDEDYKKIFIACLTNHEIYQSFFTSSSVNNLFDNGEGYVVRSIENIKPNLWNIFCKYYSCTLKRQVDNVDNNISEIPF